MNNKHPNFSKIEDYLFGDLSEAEKKQFEADIATNTDLKKEVNLHKMEHQTMELIAQKDLKAQLNQWKQEKNAPAEKKEAKIVSINRTRKLLVRFAAAASVLLLVGVFAGNLLTTDNATLADSFFEETAISDRANKGEVSNLPEVLIPGVQAMQAGDYQKAVDLFAQINDPAHQATAQILQAECYFQLKNYQNTITISNQLINSTDDSIQEKAAWYLILSHLALEDTTKAKELLQPILQNKDHSFHPYAKDLARDLSSFWQNFKF